MSHPIRHYSSRFILDNRLLSSMNTANHTIDQLKHTLSISSTPLCQGMPIVTTLISSLHTPQDFERLCQDVTDVVHEAYDTCILKQCHDASMPESTHEHTLSDTMEYMQAVCKEYTNRYPSWMERIQTILRPLDILWYKQHTFARAQGHSPPWYTLPQTSVHWVSFTSNLDWNEVARAYLKSLKKVVMTLDSNVHVSETQWTIVPRWVKLGIDDRLSHECAALTRRSYLMTPPNTMFQLQCDSLEEMVRWLHRVIDVEQTYQRVLAFSTSSTSSAFAPGWTPTMLRQMMDWWSCSEADRELDRTMESFPMTSTTPPLTAHAVRPKCAWHWPELRYAFHHRDDTVVSQYFREWIVQWESYRDCECHRWLMHASTPPPNQLDSNDYPFSLYHRMNIFRCYLRDVIRQTQWTPESLCEWYGFVRDVVEPVLYKDEADEPDDEYNDQNTVTLSQFYRFIGHEVYNELYLNDPERTESGFCGWLYEIVSGYPDPLSLLPLSAIAAKARVRWNIWDTIASQFIQPEALLQWYIDHQLKPTALNGWAYKTKHEQNTFHAMRKAYQTACAPLMPGATHASLWTLVDDIVEQMDVASASVSPEARGCSSCLRTVHRTIFAMHSVRWPYPNKRTTTISSQWVQPLQPFPLLHPSWKAIVDHSLTPYQQNHPSNQLTIHPRASWVQATLTIDIKTPTTTDSSSLSSPIRQIIPRIVPTHSQLFATYTVSSTEGDDTCCSICSEPFNQACKNPQCMQCQSDFQEGCRLPCSTEHDADQLQSYKDSVPVVQEGRCGHRYHGCCIATWLQRQRWEDADPTCPMCRQLWVYNTNDNQDTELPLCCQDCQETPDNEDDDEDDDYNEDDEMDDDRSWLTCSDLSDDASNCESRELGESSSEDEDYEDDDTALDDTHHYTCTIRGPLHLMNLLTWMTDDAEVTTVVQLSERIDGSSIPSAALRADIMHLCEVIPWLTYSEGTGLWFVEWTMNDAVEQWKKQQEKQTKDHPKETDIVLGELC